MNKTTIEGNNYITPTFTAVDGGDMSIRGVQMDATVGDLQANFQRLDYEAGSACYYAWYNTCISAQVPHDICGSDISHRNTGRNGRSSKHEFLHFCFPFFGFGFPLQSASSHLLEVTLRRSSFSNFTRVIP